MTPRRRVRFVVALALTVAGPPLPTAGPRAATLRPPPS